MKFIKSFSIYTLSSFIDRGLAFFLLPLFTYYLMPSDYGTLSLITTLTLFLSPFITLGTAGAISVNYFKLDKKHYPSYFSATIIPSLAVSLFLFIVLMLGGGNLLGNYLDIPSFWLIIIPIGCLFEFIKNISLIDFQIKGQPLKYSSLSLFYSFFNIGLSLLFVVTWEMGYEGRLLGQYITGALIFTLLIFYLKKTGILTFKIKKEYIKDCLTFGLPLIPHMIGGIIINMSDRIFIDKLMGKEQLGIYNVGYTIGSIIMIINMAFSNTIVPYSFERFTKNDKKSLEEVVKMYWLFIVFLIVISLCIFLFLPIIFDNFINYRYAEGRKYVYWITMAYVFNGIYLLFTNLIFYLKKTKILLYVSFFNIIINLSLNYILISHFGTIGAAYATFITFVSFTLIIIYFSHKLFKLPWFYFFKHERQDY